LSTLLEPYSEWVEALGWSPPDETSDGAYYHWKSDELTRSNPSALVPTVIPIDPQTQKPDESKAVYESLVVVDYLDAMSKAPDNERLFPTDPYWAAHCRLWADKVNRECCSTYYGVLVRTDPEERKQQFAQLVRGLERFAAKIGETPGPTFLPNSQMSSVDIALIPWAFRYFVLEHYRGPNFAIPRTPSLEKYHAWYDHVMALDWVKRTLPEKERYRIHIKGYADGTARSKVSNAVKRGVAAHELDNDIDT
jgi:glutathione S-transferase